ncbi:MAG TPA: peptidase dimerization domain-containing protein, partial [Candidatus Nitrosocosmicus sp.]|nr:peptidase dimerization domain-containing protein [Candidatus Nitrosocosmicus sp.]
GFRGGFNATLSIKTSSTDLHSGLYGGVVPNAIHEMNSILNKIVNSKNNEILIPNFYDDVDAITPELLENNKNIPFSEEHFKKIAGVKELVIKSDYDVYSLLGLMPTIQVTGIYSGYVGEGYRNSVPAQAIAKINFRLVESQKPEKIIRIVTEYLSKIIPSHVDHTFEVSEPYEGIKIDFNNKYAKKTIKIVSNVYGKKPTLKFCGGSIPIVTYFKQMLGLENVLVPLGNEDCAMHAVDENFRINYIEKGLEFSYEFLKLET